MNFIVIHNIDNLKIILDSSIFLTEDDKRQNEETLDNMWAISIDSVVRTKILIDDLMKFISVLIKKRMEQVSQASITCPVIFYMWFDEMAAQLRFNIISDFGKKLPFECTLEIIDSPKPILKNFLVSHYHDGIPWDELDQSEVIFDEDEEQPFILQVFVVHLN